MLTALFLVAQLSGATPVDTPPPRPRPRVQAIEVSDWYSRRLTLHRRLSYATLPLFALQYAAGSQIWEKGRDAPRWALDGHRVGATTLAAVFTVNTVTGLWNLWDSRAAPEGRTLRYVHAGSMLLADAGFTWAGAVLSERAERDPAARRQHRIVALSSIGITISSALLMKFLNQ